MNSIQLHSPHLSGVIKRHPALLGGFDDASSLDLSFSLAIENGGLSELDFEREPEVSFNPRPARVGLILLQDAGITAEAALEAAFLATLGPALEAAALPHRGLIRSEVFHLANLSLRPAKAHAASRAAEKFPGDNERVSLGIAMSMLLDRVRHLHLAAAERRSEVGPALFREAAILLELAGPELPRLCRLLETWKMRAAGGKYFAVPVLTAGLHE